MAALRTMAAAFDGRLGECELSTPIVFNWFSHDRDSTLNEVREYRQRSCVGVVVSVYLPQEKTLVRSIREHLVAEPVVAAVKAHASQELPQVERQEPLFNLCRF